VSSVATGRAALGAALVTASILLLYVAWVRATDTDTRTVVVAARSLDPGHTLVADDLRVEEIQLDGMGGAALRTTFGQIDVLIGATTLGPVGDGELLQAGSVIKKAGGPASLEIGLSLEPADAVGGKLRAGDRVDVYLADGDDRAVAPLLASDVPIVWVGPRTESSGPRIQLTIGLPDRSSVAAIVGAKADSGVSLVRSTGVGPSIGRSEGAAPGAVASTTESPNETTATPS
jgi:hypothetical protein